MNLQIIKFMIPKVYIDKNNNFSYIKKEIEDNIENKKKYGIPVLSIINDEVKDLVPVEIESTPVLENKPQILENKLVSLTFDDGPTKYTNQLLEILNRNHSRATFFILGNNIRGNEEKIKEISSYGNEIGIHGYSHKPFTDMHIDDVDAEVAGTYSMLDSLGVNPSNIVRPPFGKLNETIKEQVKSPLVLWNIDTEDVHSNNKEAVKNKIMDNIVPGSIIKMHDTSELTLEVLDEVLPILISKGYKFVTIDEMNKRYSNELVPGRVYAKIKEYVA